LRMQPRRCLCPCRPLSLWLSLWLCRPLSLSKGERGGSLALPFDRLGEREHPAG